MEQILLTLLVGTYVINAISVIIMYLESKGLILSIVYILFPPLYITILTLYMWHYLKNEKEK